MLLRKSTTGKILYAIAYEVVRDGQIANTGVVYTHALSAGHARRQFMPSPDPSKRIVAVAPAIGVFETPKGVVF